ncbi:MAG: trypsin-like serine protease [Candidatus Velamenicoccus archaeovorus]
MRRIGRFLLVATVLCLAAVPTAPAGAIVGGQLDGNRHPEVGALIGFDPDAQEYFLLCSGTLISPTVFLTAAHCTSFLEDLGGDRAWASFDPTDPTDPSTLHEGTLHTNPEYPGPFSRLGDIGVLVFDQAVSAIAPAHLPTEGVLDQMQADGTLRSTRFTAVGYGTARTDKTGGPNALVFDGQRRFATQSVNTLNANWLRLSMNVSTGSGGTCFGDSGGPHFIGAGQTETDVVAAITITGDSVCRATDVDYRMDTPSARDFLGDFVTLP